MPLAVSNILWSAEQDEAALNLAQKLGLDGIEIAPTRIAPWEALSTQNLADYRARLAGRGLLIPSLQAIYFGCTGVALLDDDEAFDRMARHTARVAQIAHALGAHVLVYGAPKTRQRGQRSQDEALLLATERLTRLAPLLANEGVVLGLEPVPASFGCDFIQTGAEALHLARMVNHPAIRFHMDMGALQTSGENAATLAHEAGSFLAHIHASAPGLAPLSPFETEGKALDAALKQIGYKGWVSIEIKPHENALAILESATQLTRAAFASLLGAP